MEAASIFSKSARRTGNIYAAPTELIAFLATDRYKDIAPTELNSWKAHIGRELHPYCNRESRSTCLVGRSALSQIRRAGTNLAELQRDQYRPDRDQIYRRNCELAPRRGQ